MEEIHELRIQNKLEEHIKHPNKTLSHDQPTDERVRTYLTHHITNSIRALPIRQHF